ncbi:olfactory receptor 14J1-like [Zonotrichia albicollis]|uniref:olfactory receptor 14J1-like n=1 Tax=Zonotrichia albicollis TaxID=44394 RepID=UPI003D80D886
MITPQAQAEGLRAHEVMTTTRAAREAIRAAAKVVASPAPWSTIKQSESESFTQFVDRLQAALDSSSLPSEAKGPVLADCLRQQSELSLLTVMCYDRYVSICKPLHYGILLGSRACAHMAAAAWASGFLYSLLHTANTFSLPLCHGNALGQFFCEIPQILKLSCSHSNLKELWLIAVSTCLALGCFVFIVFSYVQIFRAVLRIPSEQGRHKAFSTCFPHLTVVFLFVSTAIFAHLKPSSISSPSLDMALSVLYSVVPPALNPLIYSLRNKDLSAAVRRLMIGWYQKH